MTDETKMLSEAEEMSALLPWYVTGRISDADRSRLEDYAERHPAFAAEVTLAREEADIVFALNQDITPPVGGLERLRQSVSENPRAKLNTARASLIDGLANWLGGFAPRQLAYGAVAAVAAFAIQAVTLTALVPGPSTTGGFETASHGEAATGAAHALVAFQAGADVATVTQALSALDARIVDGPRAGGLYRIQFAGDDLDEAAITERIDKLNAQSNLVKMVSRARTK